MQSMIIVTNGWSLVSSPDAMTVVQEPTQPASKRSVSSGVLDSIFAMQMFAAFVHDHVPAIDPIERPCGNSALMIEPTGVMNSSARWMPPSAHGMS